VSRYSSVTLEESAPGFALFWCLNHATLAEDASFDGIDCLLTNDTAPDASLHRVFHDYKGQPKVEGASTRSSPSRFRFVRSGCTSPNGTQRVPPV
jgi:hypothetical protein